MDIKQEDQSDRSKTAMLTRAPRSVKFELGQTVITPHALKKLHPEDTFAGLSRHACGDWGDVDLADWKENEFSLPRRLRLFSVYHDRNGTKFWVITEADRSATTILLPEDY
jgi:hypothetical protein